MAEVLFVSKPVAPPWNDSSKNLVRDVAGHLTLHSPVLMGRPGEPNPIDRGRVVPVYTASSGGFSPRARDNLRVLRYLLVRSRVPLWHFFFAPNWRSSAAGGLARSLRRVPSVHTLCSTPAEGVDIDGVRFADVTVALSRSTYERLLDAGAPENEIRCIPPSVPPLPEPTPLERVALRSKYRLPESSPVWIYPGDLELGGGAEIALRGFAEWNRSDAALLMACRHKTARAAGALANLKAQARHWGIADQVRWLGERPDIHDLLALSDFVVMVNESTYAKMDYPLVVLEAMSMARPVLVGRATPSAELAASGGVVAVDANGEALANAVEGLSSDDARRDGLGQAGRSWALSRFSPSAIAAAYERIYEELHG